LDRFLVLGTEGGTYYLTEKALTLTNVKSVTACLAEDPTRTINRIVEVSQNRLAPKNDPAIFALAVAFGAKPQVGPEVMEQALLKVCQTGTDILHFCEYVQSQLGWGRTLRRAVSRWYGTRSRSVDDLAYQLVKYRQRDNWAQRDVLRLAHPVSRDPVKRAIFALVAGKYDEARYREALGENPSPKMIEGYFAASKAKTEKEVVEAIKTFGITREMVPTEHLTPKVWGALLHKMPVIASIRNLGNLSKHDLLSELSEGEKSVLERLSEPVLQKAKVHPLQVLSALLTYSQGHGTRGSGTWKVNSRIVDALDRGFEYCFKNVEPTGLRIQVALDVSGSMSSGTVGGVSGLSPRMASAALSMIFARRESNCYIMAFSDRFMPLNIGPRQRLDDVVQATSQLPFMRTDCSLPMICALQKKIPTDLFIVLTDNETWAGQMHPYQALTKYRNQMNINSKLVVVGMTANKFTIAVPNDPGMLDVVGYSSDIHQVITSFASLQERQSSRQGPHLA
jgi:60 kDa SS-A/Ro ribonucleoprotein